MCIWDAILASLIVSFLAVASKLRTKYWLHKAFEVLWHPVVYIKSWFLGIFQLHLVNVSVRVSYHWSKQVVWKVRCLSKWNELRTHVCHTFFHSLLHSSKWARGQEAWIVDWRALFQEVLQAIDFENKLEDLGVSGIRELLSFNRRSEYVEHDVLEVGLDHDDLRLIEGVIVFDFCRCRVGNIVFHGRGN